MNRVKIAVAGCGLFLAMGPAACSLSKPYPAKQLYALDCGAPQSTTASSPGASLRVLRVRVAEPFSNREFHYLTAPNQFQKDYYANFVADPDQLLTAELVEWMTATGLYSTVVDAASPVNADRSLQCVVSQLYGDMSEPGASPRAVVEARFFLFDDTGVDAKVLFNRDYREAEPVDETGTVKLAQGWGRAMEKILQRLVTDLQDMR